MGSIEHVGDAGLKISLELPNERIRDGLASSLDSWLGDYQRSETVYRLAKALAQGTGEEDTSGHLYTRWTVVTSASGETTAWKEYRDFISFL